ncbi:MAG: hypothetical protein KIT84_18925 [Labilithrix sp.]|nr:hypothetical protein [Labilithrix sp.]MCW5813109.1 hypothetical protein [Labilithrix sp.]
MEEGTGIKELFPGVYRAARPQPNGWENAMYVLRLADGSLLVHSATRLGAGAFDELRALGDVRWLLAPNHYHHVGIPAYREAFPAARVIASATAARRLRAKGHEVTTLDTAGVALPGGASFLVGEGTKNGETFVSWPTPEGRVWLVCDAFFNVPSLTRASGAILRALRTGPGLAIGQTFCWVGVGEKKVYRAWLEGALEREPPKQLLFSHGAPLVLAERTLHDLVARRL